jgi:hypothetical protein
MMLTSIVTLPLRLGIRSVELGLNLGEAAVEQVLSRLGGIVAPDAPKPSSAPPRAPSAREPSRREPASPPRERASSSRRAPRDPRASTPAPENDMSAQEELVADRPEVVAPPPPSAEPPVPAPPEPVHVLDEDDVVEEVADPGAEDGAGAELHVAEPWPGYEALTAPDVVDQLTGRSPAELAAVELFEQTHRQRRSVIEAAETRLRSG